MRTIDLNLGETHRVALHNGSQATVTLLELTEKRDSVRQAVRGAAVEELVEVVHTRFLTLDDQEKVVRTAMAKLESDFLRRFMELS